MAVAGLPDLNIRNRFDDSNLSDPAFFGQTWTSWAIFVILIVTMWLFALSLNRALRRAV